MQFPFKTEGERLFAPRLRMLRNIRKGTPASEGIALLDDFSGSSIRKGFRRALLDLFTKKDEKEKEENVKTASNE